MQLKDLKQNIKANVDKKSWDAFFKSLLNAIRNQMFVPYDTGNLKFSALRGIWSSNNTFQIYVDESIAPYMKYTQEPWKKGKNPNEGWFDKLVQFVSNYIAVNLNGEIKNE